MASRIAAAAHDGRDRLDALARVLRPFRLRRRGTRSRGSRASSPTSTATPSLLDRSRQAVSRLDDAVVGVAPHSLRACTPAELTVGDRAWPAMPPCTSIWPSKRKKWKTA